MAKGHDKGSAFERKISKELSLWWTSGKRDDIFYRTSQSGGRATTRSKQSKDTFGQYGDIQAADPIGQPLMDLVSIELKTGYKGACMLDVLEKTKTQHPLYERFLEQAEGDAKKAGVPFWLLITRRHGKQIMVWMPSVLFSRIKRNIIHNERKVVRPDIRIRVPRYFTEEKTEWVIDGFTWNRFICYVDPYRLARDA